MPDQNVKNNTTEPNQALSHSALLDSILDRLIQLHVASNTLCSPIDGRDIKQTNGHQISHSLVDQAVFDIQLLIKSNIEQSRD